jgi:hypothetical protein
LTWFWLGFSGLARFFFSFGSVRFGFFGFLLIKPNQTSRFFQILIGFFYSSVFLVIFFGSRFFGFFAHPYGEPYIPHDTMVERMVKSTSSSSNVCGIVDDNINHYRNMIMNVMRMNHGHASQCSIVDEKPNADATIFFLSFQIF